MGVVWPVGLDGFLKCLPALGFLCSVINGSRPGGGCPADPSPTMTQPTTPAEFSHRGVSGRLDNVLFISLLWTRQDLQN